MDYIVDSGTFVPGTSSTDSDLIVYLYDISSAVLIEPSSFKLLASNTTISDRFSASFQTPSNSTSYRLILHCATTSASAYVLKLDNISVSPSQYVYGTPVTDWKTEAGITCNLTNTTVTAFSRRNGSNNDYSVQLDFTGAPAAAASTVLTLPVTIDTANLPADVVGFGRHRDVGTDTFMCSAQVSSSNTVTLRQLLANATALRDNDITNTSPFSIVNGDILEINFSVPVVGQSSSVQTSDQTDTRVVAAYAVGVLPTGTITNVSSIAVFGTINKDSHAAYNTSTGEYTVPVSGWYSVSASLDISSASAAINQNFGASIFLDASSIYSAFIRVQNTSTTQQKTHVAGTLFADAGQKISIRGRSSTTTPVYATGLGGGELSIERVTGPSAIAATESVNMRYVNTAGTSIPNTGENLVPFSVKDYDSHSSWVTDTYTVPVSGKYRVSANIIYASSLYAAGNTAYMAIYKNGVAHSYGTVSPTQVANTSSISSTTVATVSCLAGDTIRVHALNSRTAGATTLTTASGNNRIEIERIGN
jgi:hypothetical protein